MKYSYTDSSGKSVSDTASKRVSLLGMNQFEYSNLTDQERTGAWGDLFDNSPLLAAFVTKMDEPVRQFAGMVAQLCGGQPAGANDDAARAFCRALYELESHNGISYQWSTGYLIEYSTGVGQELKYPRDVLRDKSGTCIELAILYAAVCESTGLKCYIQLVPGHAFPVVQLPGSGDFLPVESTGLSGPALGIKKPLTFDEAVRVAVDEMNKRQVGQNFLVDVDDMQSQGVSCPELTAAQPDAIHTWGYKLPEGGVKMRTPTSRTRHSGPPRPRKRATNRCRRALIAGRAPTAWYRWQSPPIGRDRNRLPWPA